MIFFPLCQYGQIVVLGDFPRCKGAFCRVLNALPVLTKQTFTHADHPFGRGFEQFFTNLRGEGQIFAQGRAPLAVRQGQKSLRHHKAQAGKQRCRHLKTLIMRESVSGTERVCTVEYAATPISALSIMPRSVSGSRLSPMSTTSGAARVELRVAFKKDCRWSGMALCETGPPALGMVVKSNSIGAS